MIDFQHFSKFSNRFERAGFYHFEAVANSSSRDSHGTIFDMDTMSPAVPYLPIHIEHDDQPIGSVIDYYRVADGISDKVAVTGSININMWPDVVQDIKTGRYIGVSIAGAYEPKNEIDGVIYNAIINEISLTDRPSNPDALIYKRSKKLGPMEYLRLSEAKQIEFFSRAGLKKEMCQFIVEGIARAMQ